MNLATDVHNFFEPPTGYVFNPENTQEQVFIDYEDLFFLGDMNARGNVDFTRATVDDLFVENIGAYGIRNPLVVTKVSYPFVYEGVKYDTCYLVVDGMRRGLALDKLISEGKNVGGMPSKYYKVPCVIRGDIDPFDEAGLDSAQLVLNDHTSYTSAAKRAVISKYIRRNYRPTEIAEMLGVTKQFVSYYSKLGKDEFASSLVENNEISVNVARKLMDMSERTGLTTEQFYEAVKEQVGPDKSVKVNDLNDYLVKVSPQYNEEKPALTLSHGENVEFIPVGENNGGISESSSRKKINSRNFEELYEYAGNSEGLTGPEVKELLKRLVTGIEMDTPEDELSNHLIAKFFTKEA